MKFAIFVLFACVALSYAGVLPGKSFYDCEMQTGDAQLYSTSIVRNAKIMQIVRSTVTYPESGVSTKKIHCIRAIDNMAKYGNDGGSVSIVSGGINQTYVEILLTSKLGKGLDFDIEIFGH